VIINTMTTTPTRSQQQQLLEPPNNSTPFRRGSGSNQSHASKHKQSDYLPYLRADLEDAETVTFDKFLHLVFGFDPNWRENTDGNHHMKAVVSDPKFQELLSNYCLPVDVETDRYHPFVRLANYIVDKLQIRPSHQDEGLSIAFCRNDSVPVRGSFGERKPDVVVVMKDVLGLPGRDSADNLSKAGPTELPFQWVEILAFWEFKLVRKDLTKLKSGVFLDSRIAILT
jgi:hypothetical protein